MCEMETVEEASLVQQRTLQYARVCSLYVRMPNPAEIRNVSFSEIRLRDIVEQRYDLVIQCSGCLKVSNMDVLVLIHKFGPDSKLEPIRFKLRCIGCGRRRATPLLFNRAYPGHHAWWPWPPDGHGR